LLQMGEWLTQILLFVVVKKIDCARPRCRSI
jgi:hypothetical protein